MSNRMVVVTGMSGAGKTSVLRTLEDMGYEAVDNLPLRLLESLTPEEKPIAVGIDCRTRDFDTLTIERLIEQMRTHADLDIRMVFLDCDNRVLRHRFTETRRRHPLAADLPLADGIKMERDLISPLRQLADVTFDTSHLSATELRRLTQETFELKSDQGMMVFVTSFAYRNGLPREADLVFDARFLDNPHYDPDLRPLTGRDQAIGDFVSKDPDFKTFLDRLTGLLDVTYPRFRKEGKSYLTIGVGCTGGRHRSVYIAERLATWFRDKGQKVELRHRELPNETVL